MSWTSWKKKMSIICTVYFAQRNFFKHLCFISMHSLLNALSEYTYFYISKNITSQTSFSVFLRIFHIGYICSIYIHKRTFTKQHNNIFINKQKMCFPPLLQVCHGMYCSKEKTFDISHKLMSDFFKKEPQPKATSQNIIITSVYAHEVLWNIEKPFKPELIYYG